MAILISGPMLQLILILFTGGAILLSYLLLAVPRIVETLRIFAKMSPLHASLPLAMLWATVLLYQFVTAGISFAAAVIWLGYIGIPALAAWSDGKVSGRDPSLSTLLVSSLLAIWLPVELGWLPRLRFPSGGPVPLDVLVAVVSGLYIFLVIRPLPGIGYVFRLRGTDLRLSLVCFALFIAFFAVPVGVSLDFVASSEHVANPLKWPVTMVGVFFIIGIPEEFLFRGVLQNLLQRSFTDKKWFALLVASLVFGFAHMNNAVPPFWNLAIGGIHLQFPWVYVALASVAGVFYGLVYWKTEKITAAALVHSLVDSWWTLFFAG